MGCGFFFFQAEDGIRDTSVTGVQTCALPISCPNSGANAGALINTSNSSRKGELAKSCSVACSKSLSTKDWLSYAAIKAFTAEVVNVITKYLKRRRQQLAKAH